MNRHEKEAAARYGKCVNCGMVALHTLTAHYADCPRAKYHGTPDVDSCLTDEAQATRGQYTADPACMFRAHHHNESWCPRCRGWA